MVFTKKAELDRRTRERSRHAALKFAAQRAKDHEARTATARRMIAAKDLSSQIQRENAAKFRRDRSARVGHGVSRTGYPRRTRSPSSGARTTKITVITARVEASRLGPPRVSAGGDQDMFFSYALGRVESTGPVRKKVAESRGEQQRAPTRHLGPPRVSADGDPEMFFSSSLGRITAGGVVETEPDREKVAESRGQQQRAGAKHLGPPQASHAARGPKPPLDTEPVEANRHGEEGGDNRRERGGGEAASVETSLEDILPLLHEKLERTRLMGLDLQRRCCARLSEVIDGPRGALPPPRRPPQPHED
ncbi:unnamed protein product [Ascophyllum nodosum]